jgi:hypothetical protein
MKRCIKKFFFVGCCIFFLFLVSVIVVFIFHSESLIVELLLTRSGQNELPQCDKEREYAWYIRERDNTYWKETCIVLKKLIHYHNKKETKQLQYKTVWCVRNGKKTVTNKQM